MALQAENARTCHELSRVENVNADEYDPLNLAEEDEADRREEQRQRERRAMAARASQRSRFYRMPWLRAAYPPPSKESFTTPRAPAGSHNGTLFV